MKAPKLFYDKEIKNIIPRGGEALYHGPVFEWEKASQYFEELMREIPFHSEERVMYGNHIITKRKIAWFGSKRKWPRALIEVKEKVEEIVGIQYDGVFCNLYENGGCGLGWHNDEEAIDDEHSSIASVSFGEERRFDLRYIGSKETYSVFLEHGALLVMQGVIQKYWEHHIPQSALIKGPRINLTFRKAQFRIRRKKK